MKYIYTTIFLIMIPFVLFGQKKSLEITKQEHIWLEKHKNKFVFTTECMYPPYIFTDKQGKLAGLIVDYLDEIQHITDINFEIVPCENFSNIITDIDEKSIDFFSSFSIDSSYNSKYKITKNYFSFPAIVLKTYNKNKKDLNNSKVLIESDLRLLRFLKQQYPNSLIQTINSESDGLKQISMEYADYCVLDFAQYSYFEKQMKTNNFVIEKTLNYNYNLSFVCNNDTLAKILDKAIDAISEKTKNSITKKWINSNKIFDFGIIFYIVLIIIILVLSLLLIFNVVKIKNIKIFHNKFLDNTKTINTTNLEFKDKDDKSNYSVESNKNISLSYLHNLSHEIRTPLNVIVGFSEIISMNSENKHEKHVEIIKKSAKDLVQIIDNLVELSSIEMGISSLHLEKLNLVNFLLEIDTDIKKLYSSRITPTLIFSTEFDYENIPAWFKTDYRKLKIIIQNLIDNAFKYTEKGNIIMSCYYSENNKILISIKDSGFGIENEKLPYIFDAFRQLNGKTKMIQGSGLGLAIVKELSIVLNGEVSIKSEKGKGSEFILSIKEL